MKYQDKSEKMARLILQKYIEFVTSDREDSIEAIILVGSLVTKSYVPGPSDIDQITILKDLAPIEALKRVLQHINQAMEFFDRSVNLSTVIYHHSDLKRPWKTDYEFTRETKHLLTIPEELLRIHDHGEVIYGEKDIIFHLPKPTMKEITAYHNLMRKWNKKIIEAHPEIEKVVKNPTVRIAVQSILSKATWHYYYATGHTCFNKHEIAHRLKKELPGYIFQNEVELATKIRTAEFKGISKKDTDLLISGYHHLFRWCKGHPVNALPIKKANG